MVTPATRVADFGEFVIKVGRVGPSARADAVRAAVRLALAREMHVLNCQPGLLWQQFYNRLQWDDEAVRALLERRCAPGAAPWMS